MKWLTKIENFVCGTLLLGATGLLMTHIILRYFFGGGFPWAEELVRFMFIWITFIGVAICVRRDNNISIDVIYNFLGKKGKTILYTILTALTIILVGILGKYGFDFAVITMERRQISSALSLPMHYVYLAIPIGCTLMFIHCVNRFIKIKKGTYKVEDLEL